MLYGFYQKYREIIFICILYTALRLSTILFMLAGPGAGNNFGILGDFPYYMQIGELSSRGLYPVISYWMEYPPIFPWLVTGVYKLSLL